MTDTLTIWHPSRAIAATGADLSWGSIARRTSGDLAFRVHNESSLYAARTVTVTITDQGTVASPSQAATQLFSIDGQTFTATASIGTLEPLGISDIITLRRATPSTMTIGTFTFRVTATADSWE